MKHVTTITATWYTNDHRTEDLEREKMDAALKALQPIFTDTEAETLTIIGSGPAEKAYPLMQKPALDGVACWMYLVKCTM